MPAAQPPFAIRGVIEGFYGVYYTFAERNELIRFLGRIGFNYYLYGPKNDRQHRMRWREPYPDDVMNDFAETVAISREAGVTFCYSIGSGVSMCYSSEEDFRFITEKFRAFFERGVRAFSIMLDDISSDFGHEADRRRYSSFAEAHADVCNRLLAWLRQLSPECTLSMCPTDYHGSAPFSEYIRELGEKLDPRVDVFYTGPEICSAEIPAEQAAAFAEAIGRKPLIWDNYPVNDLDMKAELHIGPILGRPAGLAGEVKGLLVNTMIQAEASKAVLLTFADYFKDPAGYDPKACWPAALHELAGASFEQLLLFSELSLSSCLKAENAVKLGRLTTQAMDALKAGKGTESKEVKEFDAYVSSLDEACYHLKNRMRNTALRNNLLPWIELLEHYHWMTKRALLVLAALERGEAYDQPFGWMKESRGEIAGHPKRIGGERLLEVADYAAEQVRRHEAGQANGI